MTEDGVSRHDPLGQVDVTGCSAFPYAITDRPLGSPATSCKGEVGTSWGVDGVTPPAFASSMPCHTLSSLRLLCLSLVGWNSPAFVRELTSSPCLTSLLAWSCDVVSLSGLVVRDLLLTFCGLFMPFRLIAVFEANFAATHGPTSGTLICHDLKCRFSRSNIGALNCRAAEALGMPAALTSLPCACHEVFAPRIVLDSFACTVTHFWQDRLRAKDWRTPAVTTVWPYNTRQAPRALHMMQCAPVSAPTSPLEWGQSTCMLDALVMTRDLSLSLGGRSPLTHVAQQQVCTSPSRSLSCHLFESVWQAYLEALIRSVVVAHLLAMFRLLLFAVPLRRCRPRANSVVRASRTSLKGAALALVLSWSLPVAAAMPNGDSLPANSRPFGSFGLPDNPANHYVSHSPSCTPPTAAAGVTAASQTPVIFPLASDVAGDAADSVAAAAFPEPGLPDDGRWFLPVVGLLYQRPLVWVSARGDTADEDNLFEAAESQFCADIPECHVVVVYPQPNVAAPTFLVVLPCASYADLVPVCLQVYQRGSIPWISMEYLDATSFLSDFVALLPEEYRPGVQIFVGDRSDPLNEYDTVHLCPGLLIRTFPESIPNPRRALTLQTKLTRAWDEFNDLAVGGSLDHDHSRFVIGVFEPAELPRALPTLEGSLDELKCAVARFLHRPRALFQMIEPLIDSPSLAILGIPVSRLFGVVPVDCAQWIPIFVDPRAVAQHFRVVLLPPVPLTIADFLRYSHVRVPSGFEPTLIGLGTVQEYLPRLRFSPREVICIRATVPPCSSESRLERFASDPDDEEDSNVHGPSKRRKPEPSPGVRQQQRHPAASSGCRPGAGSAQQGHGVEHAVQCPVDMWNRGTVNMKALSPRPPEDTPVFDTATVSRTLPAIFMMVPPRVLRGSIVLPSGAPTPVVARRDRKLFSLTHAILGYPLTLWVFLRIRLVPHFWMFTDALALTRFTAFTSMSGSMMPRLRSIFLWRSTLATLGLSGFSLHFRPRHSEQSWGSLTLAMMIQRMAARVMFLVHAALAACLPGIMFVRLVPVMGREVHLLPRDLVIMNVRHLLHNLL